MTTENFAQLPIETITGLLGLPSQKGLINPRMPHDMAAKIRVTFRPLPRGYRNKVIVKYRRDLEMKLRHLGVSVIPWRDACEHYGRSTFAIFRIKKIAKNINAVFDVDRQDSVLRRLLRGIAERVYQFKRRADMSVTEILRLSGWADDFALRYLQDATSTQIVTMMPFNNAFSKQNSAYGEKIAIGMSQLIAGMSELVIGIESSRFSLVNLNLSDSVYPRDAMDDFLLNSLIPKMYTPIRPPLLIRFEQGEFDPSESESTRKLSELSKRIGSTALFPKGSIFKEKVTRQSHVDVIEKMLEGRTASSYGYIALAEAPVYVGEERVDRSVWDGFDEVEGLSRDFVRVASSGRWYIRTFLKGKETIQQVPDIWVAISRSGSDKSNLDVAADIVKIGLIKGKMHLKMPKGAGLRRKDIRPSFDSYVILAQALAAALYVPEIAHSEMSIIHFHGYPSPCWFESGECYSGVHNPSLPCGTAEAALLNYSAIYDMANYASDELKMLCVIESEHGVNVMAADTQYLVERLSKGVYDGTIQLGCQYLPELKASHEVPARVARQIQM